ncbi:MAG: ester cyclase [Ktedonobacteraceae bacterium]
MSAEENKALTRRFYEEVFNKKNLAACDEFIDPNGIDHGLPPGLTGIEGTKQFISMYLAAFPDLQMTIEDLVAEGDRVALRWTCRGTHRGELMGIPPTGRQVTVTGIEINRFAGGKSIEHWLNNDTFGMLQQLGVIPAPGQAS